MENAIGNLFMVRNHSCNLSGPMLRSPYRSAAALAATALVSLPSVTAQDHAFHHPEGAAFAVRCPDLGAARKAWNGSSVMRFLGDERVIASVRELSVLANARPLDQVRNLWPGEYLEGVTALSFSVTPLKVDGGDGSLFGYVASFFSGTGNSVMAPKGGDPLGRAQLRLVLDFETEEAADAWSLVGYRLADESGLEAVPEPMPPSRAELLGFTEGSAPSFAPSFGRYKRREGVDTVGILSRITVGKRVLMILGPDAPTVSGADPSGNALRVFDSLAEPVLLDLVMRDAGSASLKGDAASMAPFFEIGLGLVDPLFALIMEGGRRTVAMNGEMFAVRGSTVVPSWDLAGVMGAQPLTDGAIGLVHPAAQVAHVTSLDAAAAGAWMQSLAVQADAVEFLEGFGVDPERDVAAAFGDTMALEVWPIRGVTTMPDVFLMATLRDPSIAGRLADAGQRILSELAPNGSVVTKLGYRGALIYTLAIPGAQGLIVTALNFRPTVIIHGTTAAFATSVSSAKRWVRAQGKEHDVHAGLLSAGAPPEAGSVSYGNWPAVFADAYGHVRKLGSLTELVAGRGDSGALRSMIEKLPEPALIQEFFRAGTAWTKPRENGATYRSAETSSGPIGFLVVAGLGATVFAPVAFDSLMEAQENVTRANLQRLQGLILEYTLNEAKQPTSLSELKELYPEWLTDQGALLDAWGQPFRYEPTDDYRFQLWSIGPNGQDEGGEGDDLRVGG